MEKKFGDIVKYARRPVGRRKVKNRRSSYKQNNLDHIPEKRVNKVNRRMLSDRRGLFSDDLNTFWEEA